MPTFLHPGVYVQEVPSGARPIEAVGTATAAFVGFTIRGPLAEPTFISRRQDYDDIFGGIQPESSADAPNTDPPLGDAMGHAVNAFFLNGGTTAYVVRLAPEARSASVAIPPPARDAGETSDSGETNPELLKLTAANPGTWGAGLTVRFVSTPPGFLLDIGRGQGRAFQALERFTDLSFSSSDSNFVAHRVNGVSQLIHVMSIGDVTPYLLGTSTSGPIAETVNLAALQDHTLALAVDGQQRTVSFAASDLSDLETVASHIESAVRGSATEGAIAQFTCTVDPQRRLVLTSGSRTPNSRAFSTSAASKPCSA
ncbi:MAG: hypothetical protein ACFCVA_06150 [Gammaproteobacteria bacterium]